MLRAVSTICFESLALELLVTTRKDALKFIRLYSAATASDQTVLSSEQQRAPPSSASLPLHSPPPPPPRSRRQWTLPAAAVVVAASLGGVYLYRKRSDESISNTTDLTKSAELSLPATAQSAPVPVPASTSAFPQHVQYLLVGGGTASFAAMRAIRSARPEAQVLLVSGEGELPYMRPPLSKELWREPDLAARAANPDTLSFNQWNGKRRSVVYEPSAFYTPVDQLSESGGGAAVARGWRLTRLDVARHEAELSAPGSAPVLVRYDKCLLATGVRSARVPALAAVAAVGRSLALRSVRDAARLAATLDEPRVRRVAVVGGGFLATELSAALADRLRAEDKTVVQVYREEAPLATVLPGYLAAEAERRLSELGVQLVPGGEVTTANLDAEGRVRMELGGGDNGGDRCVCADVVVECVGSEPETEVALAAGLEMNAELGGVVVNAELQARTDVYVAGDAACFHDVALGRRRVEHHDHAVLSGRLAGENMAGLQQPPRVYTHQSMFWSDLGPHLGYEAIGIIDSRLPTVGVFSADAVSDATPAAVAVSAGAGQSVVGQEEAQRAVEEKVVAQGSTEEEVARRRRYERGVVFYLREERIVGVLLWNLFNRMHVARQVLSQGKFDDLFEVAKLFALHEDE